MKRLLTALVLAAVLAVSGTAFAGTKTHSGAKVSFWIPDKWTIEGEGRNDITVSDPKGEVGLMFLVRKAKDLDGALADLDDLLADTATNVTAGEPEYITHNGMDAVVVDATGRIDGVAAHISVMIVKTPAKKFLILLGVVEATKLDAHEANLTKILASLKPLKRGNKFGN
jgi:hypothetical protein